MTLLEVESIDVYYGSVQALRGVSLRVDEGEMVALLGANGAGKTTTLRTISGLMAPRMGHVQFGGVSVEGLPAYRVVRLGLAHLPEGRDLFPNLSVEENLRYGYWTRRRARAGYRAQLDVVLDHFPRLRDRRKQAAGTLSGGEQQMLAVGRALMSSPKLLLVDELSLGLAPKIVDQLFEILSSVNREGTAVLLVEQFVHLALEHTARAYVLVKGEVAVQGRSADLLSSPEVMRAYLGEVGSEPAEPARWGARRARTLP